MSNLSISERVTWNFLCWWQEHKRWHGDLVQEQKIGNCTENDGRKFAGCTTMDGVKSPKFSVLVGHGPLQSALPGWKAAIACEITRMWFQGGDPYRSLGAAYGMSRGLKSGLPGNDERNSENDRDAKVNVVTSSEDVGDEVFRKKRWLSWEGGK